MQKIRDKQLSVIPTLAFTIIFRQYIQITNSQVFGPENGVDGALEILLTPSHEKHLDIKLTTVEVIFSLLESCKPAWGGVTDGA